MRSKRLLMGTVALGAAEAVVVGRRRGRLLAVNTVVRCRKGHLFTTMWIPGGSVKAVRLGWWRYQRCPVGKHWSLVTPVKMAALTPEDRDLAASVRDVRIP